MPAWLLDYAGRLEVRLLPGVQGKKRFSPLRDRIADALAWGFPYFDIDLDCCILSPEIIGVLSDEFDLPEHNLVRIIGHGTDVVDSLTRTDFYSVISDAGLNLLVKVNRAIMANCLEVSNPFLAFRLVEHTFGNTRSNWKVSQKESRST